MNEIKDEKLLKNLIPHYCKQITFPKHTDRNKALFSIKEILEVRPTLSSSLDVKCQNTIKYISNMSILENVKGPAEDILTMIESNKND